MSSPLTDNDKAALKEAAALVKDVVNRHPLEMTGPIMTAVQILVHEVDVITHLLEGSTK